MVNDCYRTILFHTRLASYLAGITFLVTVIFTSINQDGISRNTATDQDGGQLSFQPQRSHENDDFPVVRAGDRPYVRHSCLECSPVVVEKYKLIFFTMPKVASTSWLVVFRRLMGYDDWDDTGKSGLKPHDERNNGLKYLTDYTLEQANELMTNPAWTRAIFVRDPKERLLSAYLDKVEAGIGRAGRVLPTCCEALTLHEASSVPHCRNLSMPFENFVKFLVPRCTNDHWRAQHLQMPPRYWKYINFVGHMETAEEDSKRLMQRIGAWEEYGKDGWGKYHNESMFHKNPVPVHETGASDRMRQHYTPEVERLVDELCADEYNSPFLNLSLPRIFP